MPRRPRAVAVALVAALVATVAWGASPVAAQAPTPTSDPAATTSSTAVTPVLSARRVPGLLAARQADVALQASLAPILGQVTPTTCLSVRGTGRPIATTNPDLPVMPASTEKLLTATAVLDAYGHDGTVTTAAVSTASPDAGVLDGDLYVVGAGDPLLATTGYTSTFDEPDEPYNDYAKLADALKAAGVTEIRGNVVGDESHFDTERYLSSWPHRYVTANEVGPLGALMVNDGFTGLADTPDAPTDDRHPGEPSLLAAQTLISLLRARGVTVSGSAASGPAPDGASPVASLDSLPMDVNVGEMLRRSDNTTAEVLIKDLAVHVGQQGSTAGGAAVVHDALVRLGLPVDGSVTTDGSGLDLSNRVTCDLLVAALDRQGPTSALADSLPIAGQTGTLRKRMRSTSAEGKVRAKTGTLNEVSALAGFATSASGEVLTFAFIINGALPNALTLSDQVGVALADYGKGISLDALGPASST